MRPRARIEKLDLELSINDGCTCLISWYIRGPVPTPLVGTCLGDEP